MRMHITRIALAGWLAICAALNISHAQWVESTADQVYAASYLTTGTRVGTTTSPVVAYLAATYGDATANRGESLVPISFNEIMADSTTGQGGDSCLSATGSCGGGACQCPNSGGCGACSTSSSFGTCGAFGGCGRCENCYGCELPCCKMCPCLYGWVDGVVLWRDNQAVNQPLVQNLNTGDPLLSAGDPGFRPAGGVWAGLGWRAGCGCGWELGYLGLFTPLATALVSQADTLALPGDLGLASNNFFFSDEVALRYTSQLNTAELNRVCCCCRCGCPNDCYSIEWLYGLRYLNFN